VGKEGGLTFYVVQLAEKEKGLRGSIQAGLQ
jgi:hypothetical protein